MSVELPKFVEISPPERSRKYVFPAGAVTVLDVARVCVRPSGSHRLESADGRKWIVAAGWLAIEIDMDDWTF